MKKSLRLNPQEIEIIKNDIISLFKECEIYIFGSQTDMEKRGGDIDIFVISKNRVSFRDKLLLEANLEDKLLKKVDLIISKDLNREIEKEAMKGIKIK